MGRRNLSFLASLVVALAAALAAALGASASAGIPWTALARGSASGAPRSATEAFVALDRSSTSRFSSRISASAVAKLATVDFRRQAVIAVFGEFGCQDRRIGVTSIVRRDSRFVISLVKRPLPPATMECMALFPTYRLLVVAKAALERPYPTRAQAQLAGA